MIRRIIHIDEEKCNGCGKCVHACHEGAIDLVNGKARLMREHYCDGLGDCLPSCPTGAITFEEREAPAYDEAAVKAAQAAKPAAHTGCPGSRIRQMAAKAPAAAGEPVSGQLTNWPVQIKLAPTAGPTFAGRDLLIAADCTAFSRADFHERFMKGRITLIGCPKLDEGDYAEKLTEIIRCNDIREVTIVRMEVPCCGGLRRAAETALRESGKFLPWQVVTLGRDGTIQE